MALQHRLQQLGFKPREGDRLAAGANRAEQPIRRGRQQDQHPVAGLLQGLQQGIGSALGHRLHGLHHHQAAGGLHRSAGQKLRHGPDLLEAQLGGALRLTPEASAWDAGTS